MYPGSSPYTLYGNSPIVMVDPRGDDAWKVKNYWNNDYVDKFAGFVGKQSNKYQVTGNKFTCEDFALTLLIDFAAKEKLPLNIVNETGSYNPSSDNYNDVASFKNDVLKTTGARDLQKQANTIPITIDNIATGDLILNKNNSNIATHVQQIAGGIGNLLFVNQGNSGIFNKVPGGSKILQVSDPMSFTYTGKKIEIGGWDITTDFYKNYTTEKEYSNFSTANNIEIRRWNFKSWNNTNNTHNNKFGGPGVGNIEP